MIKEKNPYSRQRPPITRETFDEFKSLIAQDFSRKELEIRINRPNSFIYRIKKAVDFDHFYSHKNGKRPGQRGISEEEYNAIRELFFQGYNLSEIALFQHHNISLIRKVIASDTYAQYLENKTKQIVLPQISSNIDSLMQSIRPLLEQYIKVEVERRVQEALKELVEQLIIQKLIIQK